MLNLRLDRGSSAPLYYQIAQAIRWRIGTGALRPGDPLPPVRVAAEHWDVNYHTVRRAYRDLSRQGLTTSVQGSGTRVAAAIPDGLARDEDAIDRWVAELLETGADRFGLSAEELARRISERRRLARVVMVECNAHESSTLARQLETALGVEAVAWSLERHGELPRLPIVGTYFHHAEMRRRWPDRVDEMHFVTLHLDPELAGRIGGEARRRRTRRVRVVEQDVATAREMAASLAPLLPPRTLIDAAAGDPDVIARSLASSELLLVAPRMWDGVSRRVRKDPRVFDLRHVIVPADLERLARKLGAVPERRRPSAVP